MSNKTKIEIKEVIVCFSVSTVITLLIFLLCGGI